MSTLTTCVLLAGVMSSAYLLRLAFSAFEANDQRWIVWLLRRQAGRRWLNYAVQDNLVPADLGYPVLFHWLLARLPRESWVPVGFLANAAFDLVVAAGVALLTVVLVDTGGGALGAAAVAALAFLFSPALFPPTARLMAFNGRSFGLLLFNLFALALGGWCVAQSVASLVIAAVLLVLIALASQFAFQAAVALSAVVVLWYADPLLLFALVATMAGVWAVPQAGLRAPLRYFAGLYRWAYRNRLSNTAPAVRSRWLGMARGHWRHRQWRALWLALFLHAPPVIVGLYGVWLWMAAALLLGDPAARTLAADPAFRFAAVAAAAMIGTCVLTAFQPFSIFGQAERYLENAAAPGALVLAGALTTGGTTAEPLLLAGLTVALAVIALNLLTVLVQRKLLLQGSERDLGEATGAYTTWLEDAPGPLRILTVPMARGQTVVEAFRGAGREDVLTLHDWLSPRDEPALEYMSRYLAGQSFTVDTIAMACRDYDVNAVVIFKDEAHVWDGARHLSGTAPVLEALPGGATVVGEDDHYAACVLQSPARADEAA